MISGRTVNSSTDPHADVMCTSGDLPKAGWCGEEAMMLSGRIADSSISPVAGNTCLLLGQAGQQLLETIQMSCPSNS